MRAPDVVLLLTLTACGSGALTLSAPTCTDLRAGSLVLSEVMIDPDGTDLGAEWLEVLNPLSTPVQLDGVTIFTRDPSGDERSTVIKADDLASGAYFTLGDAREKPSPEWLGFSYGTSLGSFAQASGWLGLRCGETVVDELRWSQAPRPGRSRMLDPNGISWCDAPLNATYFAGNHGSPGEPNPPCFSPTTCVDALTGSARPIVSPPNASLIVTEIMAAPKSATDSVGEWFELFATDDVDLNGVTVATSTGSSTLESPQCLRVSRGQYAVVARSNDPFINGGLPTPLARFTGSLSSSNERLRLFAGDAGIDEVAFLKSTSGVSWQLGIESLHSEKNDEPSAFCLSTRAWADGGGDLGSPGSANARCAAVSAPADAGMDSSSCVDGATRKPRAIVRASSASVSITEVMADPTAVNDDVGEWFEVRVLSPFDLNGLALGNEGASVSTVVATECRPVSAGALLVFARTTNGALNGGLPRVDGVFSFSLANSGARSVRVLSDKVELTRWAYSSSSPGASTQRDSGSGLTCATPPTMRYGTSATPDRGTPGRENVSCQ